MKNILLKLGLGCVMVLAVSACNDDFLERYPLDQITNETFWNTENDLAVYNNSLYNLIRDDIDVPILHGHHDGFGSHYASIWNQDEFTDNMAPRVARHNRFQQVRAGMHNTSGGDQWFGYDGWNFVRAINVGMGNYNKAQISQATKDKYIGEARLMRGWFYAEKVTKFGDVPYVERELNIDSEELFAKRTPRAEVMKKVLEDLNFASTKLPNDWGDGNAPGRLNRWAALLVKARVCLFEGTYNKYHGIGDSKMWLEEAAKASKELIEKGPYRLYKTGDPHNDYNATHRMLDLTGNPEVIQWRKYKIGVFTNHALNYFRGYSGGLTKSIVDDYLCTDGLPISLSPLYKGDETIEDVFINRDPRLSQTALRPSETEKYQYDQNDGRTYPRLEGNPGGGVKSTTGYHIIKNYNVNDLLGKAYNQGEMPAVILRFGEALLTYAEAMAELGTITQGDLDMSINKLRDRVGMPHLKLGAVPVDP
ncbi:RagB/SusD family nutrient uptake outer membrane protein, partial [Persicitalea sp.]|uniref:RagB/SusD family nutrient uptake outer membrane protein n=1 Tax=Persicitalea sp. TaxID=3100273 RepID=UPI003592F1C0